MSHSASPDDLPLWPATLRRVCRDGTSGNLTVLDEQILAMQAWDLVVPGATLLDSKDGRVLYGAVRDAQLVQQGEKFLRSSRHFDLVGSQLG
jgi:hypothetical protein